MTGLHAGLYFDGLFFIVKLIGAYGDDIAMLKAVFLDAFAVHIGAVHAIKIEHVVVFEYGKDLGVMTT